MGSEHAARPLVKQSVGLQQNESRRGLKRWGGAAMIRRQSMRARARSGTGQATAVGVALLIGLATCRTPDAPPPRPWRITVMHLDDDADAPAAVAGLGEGLRQSGLQRERDFVLDVQSAHGDTAALSKLAAAAGQNGAHTLVTIGTPALAAVLATKGTTPIVFTGVADPWLAGVRRPSLWRRWMSWLVSDEGPPVTGAYAPGSFGDLLDASVGMVKGRLGAVVPTGDPDARAYRDALSSAAIWRSRMIDFELASGPGDVGAAATRLCGQGAMGLVALGDPTTNAAFDALVQAARICGIPVFGTRHAHGAGGAVVTLARDPAEAAREAGRMVAKLARGTAVRDVPVVEMPQTTLILNVAAAERADVGLPLSLVQRADEVLED